MASDFVEHSAEIKQVADFVVGTTHTQLSHMGAHFCGPGDFIARVKPLYGLGGVVIRTSHTARNHFDFSALGTPAEVGCPASCLGYLT
jgi:hypothetical protein